MALITRTWHQSLIFNTHPMMQFSTRKAGRALALRYRHLSGNRFTKPPMLFENGAWIQGRYKKTNCLFSDSVYRRASPLPSCVFSDGQSPLRPQIQVSSNPGPSTAVDAVRYLCSSAYGNVDLHQAFAMNNSEDILRFLRENSEALDAGQPSTVLAIVAHVVQIHYTELGVKLPWLQSNMQVARLQLKIADKLTDVMQPLLSHDAFCHAVQMVGRGSEHLSCAEKVLHLQNLLFVAWDPHDPFLHCMMHEIVKVLPELDLNSLAEFGALCHQLPKGFYTGTLRRFIASFFGRIRQLATTETTVEDIVSFVNAFRNIHPLLSESALEEAVSILLVWTRRSHQELLSPPPINALCYIARRLLNTDGRYSAERCKAIAEEIIELAAPPSLKIVDQYTPREVAEICSSLKQTKHYYRSQYSVAFEAHSLTLLQHQTRYVEIINLFYSLHSQTPVETKRVFESALYAKMDSTDMITLSNMAESFYNIRMDNEDVIHRFQQLVVQQGNDLINWSQGLFSVLRFLISLQRIPSDVQNTMQETLHKFMNDTQGISRMHTPTIATFCLKTSRKHLPDYVYDSIMKSIPRWNIKSMQKVLEDLSGTLLWRKPKMQLLLAEIEHQMFEKIVERPESVQNVKHLTRLVCTMVFRSKFRDPEFMEKLMGMFVRFTKDGELSAGNAAEVAKLAYKLSFYLPDALDGLVSFVLRSEDRLSFPLLRRLLQACAKVGYAPVELERLCEVMFQRFAADPDNDDSVFAEISVLRDLSLLQVYPEKQLSNTFTLEFIEKVDDAIESRPEKQREIEQLMMELNRNVVLECPQLDIPWFHDTYCRKHPTVDESYLEGYNRDVLKEEMQQALVDLLGGPQYLKQSSLTPYYYVLDFECLLDADSQPVVYSKDAPANADELTRVAVLLLTEANYCYNSHRLIGYHQMRRRHLQIMGYRLAEVPYFDWYSMGHSDWEAKVDLLRELIFKP